MDDQEKEVQQEQKVSPLKPINHPPSPRGTRFSYKTQKFGDRLREAVSISNIRERLRRRQYRAKQGSPSPKPPPYCPHWHKARPKAQKAWIKIGTERLRVYEDGHVSRLERYEERLRDPTSKEAKQKAAREAGYSSTATTLCSGPVNPEGELVGMFERLRGLEGLCEPRDGLEEEERAGAGQEQPEEDRAVMPREEYPSVKGSMSGARRNGTVALKGKDSTKLVRRGFHGPPESPAFGWA